MTHPYELSAYLEQAGQRAPFYLRISVPQQPAGESDYFCRVHAPALFANDKEIFGATADQAFELAVRFVKSMLGSRNVVDQSGAPVNLG